MLQTNSQFRDINSTNISGYCGQDTVQSTNNLDNFNHNSGRFEINAGPGI